MSDRISVVIPTRNRAHLLAATLDCILSQSFPPSEVIVVDDGCTDATAELLDAYASEKVRHIRLEHSGHLVARNVGLKAARSELVAFCDSDDLWRPSFLETANRLWRRAPDLTVSYSNFSIVRNGVWARTTKFHDAPAGFWDDLTWIGHDLGRIDRSLTERLIEFQPFFPSGMVVHRRRFIDIGGWDEGVDRVVGSDFATALRAAAHLPVGIMRQPLVGIRKHAENLSGDTEKMNLGNARVLEHVLATRPEMATFSHEIHASIGHRRRDALAAAFVRRDLAEVRRIYRLIPPGCRNPATRIKASVAALPAPVSARISGLALWLGSSKASLMAMAAAKPWAKTARMQHPDAAHRRAHAKTWRVVVDFLVSDGTATMAHWTGARRRADRIHIDGLSVSKGSR